MRKFFEHLLLSLLLTLSVLLGLSFWLNTFYGFNLFDASHWEELALLQTERIPISTGFYVSIGVAVFILAFGLAVIFTQRQRQINSNKTYTTQNVYTAPPQIMPEPQETKAPVEKAPNTGIPIARPPRLNLPNNMAEIARKKHENNTASPVYNQNETQNNARYDSELSKIFTDAGYVVKKNPTISGFTPNLFAIGPEEILWIGAVDADVNKLQSAVNRLDSIFHDTLEDIQINISAFIIDTTNQQQNSDSIAVLKSLDELKTFVSSLPQIKSEEMTNYEKDNFNAYSEYIDTIIQYVKNMG
jgi:hypothetical protein